MELRFGVVLSSHLHADSHFTRSRKNTATVLLLRQGSRATLSEVTFAGNQGYHGEIAGLQAGGVGSGSAAVWFHSCTFTTADTAPVNGALVGMAAVENHGCRVYANTKPPLVWDQSLQRELAPWLLVPALNVPEDNEDVFAATEDTYQTKFLRPDDPVFVDLRMEQADVTGMPMADVPALPEGTQFTAKDPYTGIDTSRSTSSYTIASTTGGDPSGLGRENIALIGGVCGGAFLLAIGILAYAIFQNFSSGLEKVCIMAAVIPIQ